MRLRARRDTVEAAIVKVLRQGGCSVAFISGKDVPDLLIGVPARAGCSAETIAAEVKSGNAKLKPGQEQFRATWRGSPVVVLRSVEDAIALLEGRP